MNKTKRILAIWLFAMMFSPSEFDAQAAQKVQALVVGTIHGRHATDENYTYEDIACILSQYQPDLICVEIRPKDFRREPYLTEMMLATIWGLVHNIKVAPVDWWSDSENDRDIRQQLLKQPEYIEKGKQFNALCAQNAIITRFEKLYGPDEKESQWGKHLGYPFWNGKDYNDCRAEYYRLSLQVYGDSPINLHWRTRNTRMMELIKNAIQENSLGKVIVLTGSDHKYFFDRELATLPGIQLVEFEHLLPLKKTGLEAAVANFLNEKDALPYFEQGCSKGIDDYFRETLVAIVHGPDMDAFPGKIPQTNIDMAGKLLKRWKASTPETPQRSFDLAWWSFLSKDYPEAVARYRALTKQIEDRSVTDLFFRTSTYVNLGRCYDLLGDRKNALDCYDHVKRLLVGTEWESQTDYILHDYQTAPYKVSGR
jgi:tetratricopeptide (TPR) repeat protein